MPPYYHTSPSSVTPPPTPRIGNTFPPLKYKYKPESQSIDPSEYPFEGRDQGPFDEDDIELQLSSSKSKSNTVKGWKVLKFIAVLFLGLILIGSSLHIGHNLCETGAIPQLLQIQTQDQTCDGIECTSEDRAPLAFNQQQHQLEYNKESITVPTYPNPCEGESCLIHGVPGNGAEVIGTATIYSEGGPTFTIKPESDGPRVTIYTSPPICVPPHCYPHSQNQEQACIDDDDKEEDGGEEESPPICVPPHCYPHSSGDSLEKEGEFDRSPSICVPPHCYPHPRLPGETPPICVPPHCYPHRPPGHHNPDQHDHNNDHDHDHDLNHHHDLEHNADQNNEVTYPQPCFPPNCYPPPVGASTAKEENESPPICVPPHCFPHAQVGIEEQQDHSRDCVGSDCIPNVVPGRSPVECIPPTCHPSHSHHQEKNDDENQDPEEEEQKGPVCEGRYSQFTQFYAEMEVEDEGPIYKPPPACHPPHCYPPTPPIPSIHATGREEASPICVPPHCYPHSIPGHLRPTIPKEGHSPPICVPPHCFPHSTDDDVEGYTEMKEMVIQTDREREHEYLASHPAMILHEHDVKENEGENKPICMPPICVPLTKSPPIFVPCDQAE